MEAMIKCADLQLEHLGSSHRDSGRMSFLKYPFSEAVNPLQLQARRFVADAVGRSKKTKIFILETNFPPEYSAISVVKTVMIIYMINHL